MNKPIMVALLRRLTVAFATLCVACDGHSIGDEVLAAKIEERVQNQRTELDLSKYARSYAHEPEHYVTGVYVISHKALERYVGKAGHVRWVSSDALPEVLDGGCSVLTLQYHEPTETLVYVKCNPDA